MEVGGASRAMVLESFQSWVDARPCYGGFQLLLLQNLRRPQLS